VASRESSVGEVSARGLTAAEATARLQAEGHNELPHQDQRSTQRIVVEVVREPMLLLLWLGAGVYAVLGDLGEALILVVFALLSIGITVVQELRTERVLEALRDLTSPRALVIRDGERQRIPGRDVVRGDVVVLGEGDRVPADAALFESHELRVDESLLTGESMPVQKVALVTGVRIDMQRPGGDGLPFVFSGSLVIGGRGLASVAATGTQSEIGRIGQSLATVESQPGRLQIQVRKLVTIFAIIGASVSALVVLLYGFLRGGWLDGVLAGIAVGMSMLPEEIPVVLAVFMAMGAWRISRARVLTRRSTAIEALGSATVLCTDKTGTLTENRMSIARVALASGDAVDPASNGWTAAHAALLDFGVLAGAAEPVDPMEEAFHALGKTKLTGDAGRASWRLIREYPLRPELLAMSHAWRTNDGMVVAAKGAPEAIAALCHLSDKEGQALQTSVDRMATAGLRVLGVARAAVAGGELPESQQGFAFEFMGLVGLADALRPSAPAAVKECRATGIRVVMITGDYPATASAIARQAGIGDDDPLTGEILGHLSDVDLAKRVRTANVFARIMPEQKLRIVNALKSNGEIVAMTGDGVNDAPSLKAANIGIAMGGRGTDVAREAASIVLLDDDFGSIVHAVRLGRRIYDNLRKAMGFILAVHVPIAGLALLPLAFGLPILLGPVHIAFLQLIIDPVCSLVFEAEAEEGDVMRRPPRSPHVPLFSPSMIAWGLLQGLAVFAMVGAIFVIASRRGMPEAEVRALAFFSLVLAFVSLIFVNRSFSTSLIAAVLRPNRTLVLVLAAVVVMLGLTIAWPTASTLFRFGPLHWNDILLTLGAGAAVLIILEGVKVLASRRQNLTLEAQQ